MPFGNTSPIKVALGPQKPRSLNFQARPNTYNSMWLPVRTHRVIKMAPAIAIVMKAMRRPAPSASQPGSHGPKKPTMPHHT